MLVITTSLSAAPLTIDIRPARMDDISSILRLHHEAFADKFGVMFGARNTNRGVEAMANAWRQQGSGALRGMLVACAGNQLIGTISLRTWELGNSDGAAVDLALYPFLDVWDVLRSLFTPSFPDHQIDRAEGYITDVAVLAAYRRRGVARALLERVEEEARLRRKRYLGLYVNATNQSAQQLYYSTGFYQQEMRRSLIASWFFRQRSWIYMRKDLV